MHKRSRKSIAVPVFLLISAVFLSGCIQEKEHLTINKDGTGTFAVNLKVPKGTTDFIDMTLGGMMQGMAQMAEQMGGDASELKKASASEQMFGNKGEIIKKADAVGVNIEFTRFDAKKEEDGLYVNYEFTFDDINKLLAADLIATKFKLAKDEEGNFTCYLEKDESKAAESKQQMQQFTTDKKTGQFEGPEDAIAKGMMESMRNFKMEFLITMPNQITGTSGAFTKEDDKTARMEFSGDLLSSPELIDKLYGMDEPSQVICSAEGVLFDIVEIQVEDEEGTMMFEGEQTFDMPIVEEPAKKKLFLNDGRVIEGDIVEEAQTYIKFKVASGIIFTFSRDEIAKIE